LLSPLPIDAVLPDLVTALRGHSAVVLRAPTGSGKTTRVPPALLDAGLAGRGHLVMLEPRRVAARAAARRIAFERGVSVGGVVGYQVRFDQQIGRDTRIRIVTDGVNLRMLQADSFLEQTSIVLFDEFHERGLNVDLALAMVRRVQQTVRPDLKIVVMSATLEARPIAAFLGDCPIVEAEGKLFPVEVEYLDVVDLFARRLQNTGRGGYSGGRRPPGLAAAGSAGGLELAVEQAIKRSTGDLLVFLPGVGEIRRASDELRSLADRHNLAVMPLFGDLPAEQQDAVLGPCDRRKLVLATNVAETSITIEGVTVVIDSGQARVMRFDEHVGLDRLELTRISKASADQRAGRAGRTGPGVCLRLWSERDHQGLADHDEPEIRRVDLAGPVLQLRAWGEADLAGFPWFEPPREALLAQAEALLGRLSATDKGVITALGRQMVRLPVHPRIARLLVEGERLGVSGRAAIAAAILAERDPFLRPAGPPGRPRRTAAHRSESDVVDRVAALEDFQRSGAEDFSFGALNTGAARFVLQAAGQLRDVLREGDNRTNGLRSVGLESDGDEELQRAILAAFPDRVALRREMSRDRGVMVGGRGVRLAVESAVTAAELFVCVNVDAGRTEALVRLASAIRREWLDPALLTIREDVRFDAKSGRVTAARQTCWDDLVLEEVALSHVSDELVARALASAADENFERVFPKDGGARDYIERVRSLRGWMPELELPPLDEAQLKTLLPGLCQGGRTLDDVRRGPWLQWIKGLLTPAQLQAVEREAPERLAVPSGNRIGIEYKAGRKPVLAVRIQELFGLADTPRIAGGRVPIVLHLLAPNMRPQQVTEDLGSFWNNTYQQVRKDLRARYPKHAWPDDPWNAPPQRRPGRKS
jgi:ATP-dependent helicase HrpB